MDTKQLEDLVNQGIITSAQSTLIVNYQQKNESKLQWKKSWGFQNSLFVIWWILIFLGIMSGVAFNRDLIADSIKVLILSWLTALMYWLWYYLKYIKGKSMLWWSLLFISWLSIWATIFLIAQVYNMMITNDVLLGIRILLILPLIYLLRQKEFYYLYMALLSILLRIFFTSHTFGSVDRRNTIVLLQLSGISIVLIGYFHDIINTDIFLNKLYKIVWIRIFTIFSFIFLLSTQFEWSREFFSDTPFHYNMPFYIIIFSIILIIWYGVMWYVQKKKELLLWAIVILLFTLIKPLSQFYILHDIIFIIYSLSIIYSGYSNDNRSLREQWNFYLYWFLSYLYIKYSYWYMDGFVFFLVGWVVFILWWLLYKRINQIIKNTFILLRIIHE